MKIILFVLINLALFNTVQSTTHQKPSITKAIVPCAGLGSRFFPLTKTVPKELVPLGDKPAIHYIIQEAIFSGINSFAIITNERKKAVEHYLRPGSSSSIVQENSRYPIIAEAEKLFQQAQFSYIDQPTPRGTGDAVLIAESFIGNEFFALMYPDDIIFGNPTIGELIAIAQKYQASVIAVQEVPLQQVSNYGVVSIKQTLDNNIFEIADIVEKPKANEAPSNLAVIGRYVFCPKIFESVKTIGEKITSGENPLTDAVADMIQKGERVIAYKISGNRYDTGTPLGWIKAVVGEALQNPNYKDDFIIYLKEIT